MGFLGSVLGRLERRYSLLGESSLDRPAKWLLDDLGGGSSRAGPTVNEQTALTLASVWACVRAIAEDVAKLPIRIVARRAGTLEVLHDHPVGRLLNQRPGKDPVTAMSLRETLMIWAMLHGNAFWEITRDGRGSPTGLYHLNPRAMEIKRDRQTREIVYVYRQAGSGATQGKTVTLPARDVFHLRGPGSDSIVGWSVIRAARESLGAAMAADQFAANYWGKGGRPSGVLKHPGKLSKDAEKNLRESWERLYGGENAGRSAVLQEGMEWISLTMPFDDAQFLETRQFSVLEVCRWFRVPPHKVFDLTRATFSNIEHQALEYVTDTLQGWITRVEAEIGLKLLGEDTGLQARHVTAALLRGDLKSRYEAYAIGRQWGFRTANEIHALEDEPPVGEIGDQYIVPVNMTTPDRLGKGPANGLQAPGDPPPTAAPDPPAPGKRATAETVRAVVHATAPALEAAIERHLRAEADKVRRAHKRDAAGLQAWMTETLTRAEYLDQLRGVLFGPVEAATRAAAAAVGIDLGAETVIPAAVLRAAMSLRQRSFAQIVLAEKGIADPRPEGVADVGAVLEFWERQRPGEEARDIAWDLSRMLIRDWKLEESTS
ncbi:MAG: phage portal protein [Phycisphaerales bacterium]